VRVDRGLEIPEDEILLRFSPSGGPGGQHANRSSTRVDLTWNIAGSRVLTARQRRLLKAHLKGRIDPSGNLRLSSDTHRSQLRNREEVRRRLAAQVAEALRPRPQRLPTQPSRAARQRRLTAKRRRAETKRLRRPAERE
jgi:ribosome-associated protein